MTQQPLNKSSQPNGRITLPFVPPSVNHAYITTCKNGRVLRFPTKDAKSFKEQVALACRTAGVTSPIPKGTNVLLQATYVLPNNRARDLDNLLKMTQDGMNGIVFEDDNQVTRIIASKSIEKGVAHTEILWWVL